MIKSGTIAVPKKLDVYERLEQIYHLYSQLAIMLWHSGLAPEEVHIEQLVRNTHIYTHYSVACIGIALYPFCSSIRGDIPIKSWQKFSGWEEQKARYECGELKGQYSSEDELAAICMGIYHTQGR